MPERGACSHPPNPPSTRPAPRHLRGDEPELYHRHHNDLECTLSRAINASPALIEDACQTAWTQFLRYQPNRPSVFVWLYVVARNEAYRLADIERHELPVANPSPDLGCENRITERVSLDDQLQARDALRALAQLPTRQQRDLTLLIAGFTYREIAQMTGRRTYTNVNKHLVKARARIRLTRR